jgi:hypothetical protein
MRLLIASKIGHDLLLDISADYDDRHMMQILLFGKEAASLHRGPAGGVAFFGAAKLDPIKIVAFVLGGVDPVRRKQKRAYMFYGGGVFRDGPRVLQAERFTLALFPGSVPHGGGFGHDDGVRAKAA